MQRLRRQVDKIDLQILKLLQQRTKLSLRIGEAKHQHHAAIYVPERERDLLARVTQLSEGKLPPKAAAAIYREILSSSRAVQGQAPIGVLNTSAGRLIPPGRWCFGACDTFTSIPNWPEMAAGVEAGSLTAALLTGKELAGVLRRAKNREQFLARLTVVGEISPAVAAEVPLAERIFIVTPRGKGAAGEANRGLILIECKSTVNAVKSLLNSMQDQPTHAEQLAIRSSATQQGTTTSLFHLTLPQSVDGIRATSQILTACKSAGIEVSILGVYPGNENYGG